MKIYLNKAVSAIPNSSSSTPTPEQSVREFDESYEKDPVGVSGGDMSPDRDDVGKKWRGTKVDEDEDKAVDDEDAFMKALSLESHDLLKSLNEQIETEKYHRSNQLNPTEHEFLTKSLGYSEEDVRRGNYRVTQTDRAEFNKWLCDRLATSVSRLKQ